MYVIVCNCMQLYACMQRYACMHARTYVRMYVFTYRQYYQINMTRTPLIWNWKSFVWLWLVLSLFTLQLVFRCLCPTVQVKPATKDCSNGMTWFHDVLMTVWFGASPTWPWHCFGGAPLLFGRAAEPRGWCSSMGGKPCVGTKSHGKREKVDWRI